MVKDLWVNMDRFSEMTKDLGDIGVDDAKQYSDLSRQLGSEVSVKDAILDAVINPREFEENKTAMEAEVAARGSDPAKEFETIFIGAEAAELGSAIDKMRDGINNPEGNAAMANMQKTRETELC